MCETTTSSAFQIRDVCSCLAVSFNLIRLAWECRVDVMLYLQFTKDNILAGLGGNNSFGRFVFYYYFHLILLQNTRKEVTFIYTFLSKHSNTLNPQCLWASVLPGNLLVIDFVSYFGAKLHRPKIIAVGCVLMSIGTFIIALPHFIIGR